MKSSPTISLAIIAKDETRKCMDIYSKYYHYFDEVHIAYDKDCLENFGFYEQSWKPSKKEREEKGLFLHKYTWQDNFAHKRNFLASKITTDYYFRLDTDDEVVGLENLQEFLENMEKTKTDVVMCLYEYATDVDGNVTTAHYRETIVSRKNPHVKWNKPVHENIIADSADDIRIYRDDNNKIVIRHKSGPDHFKKSLERNFKILWKEYEADGDNTDPRTLAYLGRTLCSMKRLDEAIRLLDLHIRKSGWDEDRYISYLYLSEALCQKNDTKAALQTALMAVNELPSFPAAYAKLAEIHFNNKHYDKCIEYGKIALSKPQPQTNMMFDPAVLSTRLPIVMCHSYIQLNDVKKAVSCFKVAKRNAPSMPSVQATEKYVTRALEEYNYMENLLYLIKYTDEHEPKKVKTLIQSIPSSLNGNDMIMDLRHKYTDPKVWADNEIMFFCCGTQHMWSPNDTATGVGGSEEAMIHLGTELVNLGKQVTVYGNFADEYERGGVKYLPQHMLNRNDKFSTIVWWRSNMSHLDVNAKHQIMWIHDLPRDHMLAESKTHKLNKIVVLSEYHKSLLPKHIIDSGKVVVSHNGINPSDFDDLDNIEREPNTIIYASSYDRGLEAILRNWSTIREAVPTAELNIYYGWNIYDEYIKMGLADQKLKQDLVALMEQPGITEHGRIGHKALAQAYASSSVWAYPCIYTGEINCIALTKAMATNCNIITNKFAVMGERSPNAVDDDKFIEGVINELKSPTKKGTNKEYIEANSWSKVAEQWQKEIL